MSSVDPRRRWYVVLWMVAVAAVSAVAATAGQPDSPVESTATSTSRKPTLTPAKAETILEERVRRNPNDFFSATLLGRVRLKLAKAGDDAQMYARAEAAFRQALSAKPNDKTAQTYLAVALSAQHRFVDAREVLRPIIQDTEDDSLARAVWGDVMLETGDYDAAEQAYQRLAESVPGAPEVLARQAHMAELRGKTAEAEAFMRQAVKTLQQDGAEPADQAWYTWRLAELLFAQGNFRGAREQFTAILAVDPAYEPAIAGMALVCAAEDRLDEAIELQRKAVALTPDLHGWWVLGDLYTRQGRTAEATEAYTRAEAVGKGQPDLARLLAHFYADRNINLDAALALITEDMKQRQDIHGYDILAWVHFRAGRLDDAAEAINRATAIGTQDALIHFHAGMIHLARGERDKARTALRRALEINPGFSILHAPIARQRLAELNARQ